MNNRKYISSNTGGTRVSGGVSYNGGTRTSGTVRTNYNTTGVTRSTVGGTGRVTNSYRGTTGGRVIQLSRGGYSGTQGTVIRNYAGQGGSTRRIAPGTYTQGKNYTTQGGRFISSQGGRVIQGGTRGSQYTTTGGRTIYNQGRTYVNQGLTRYQGTSGRIISNGLTSYKPSTIQGSTQQYRPSGVNYTQHGQGVVNGVSQPTQIPGQGQISQGFTTSTQAGINGATNLSGQTTNQTLQGNTQPTTGQTHQQTDLDSKFRNAGNAAIFATTAQQLAHQNHPNTTNPVQLTSIAPTQGNNNPGSFLTGLPTATIPQNQGTTTSNVLLNKWDRGDGTANTNPGQGVITTPQVLTQSGPTTQLLLSATANTMHQTGQQGRLTDQLLNATANTMYQAGNQPTPTTTTQNTNVGLGTNVQTQGLVSAPVHQHQQYSAPSGLRTVNNLIHTQYAGHVLQQGLNPQQQTSFNDKIAGFANSVGSGSRGRLTTIPVGGVTGGLGPTIQAQAQDQLQALAQALVNTNAPGFVSGVY